MPTIWQDLFEILMPTLLSLLIKFTVIGLDQFKPQIAASLCKLL